MLVTDSFIPRREAPLGPTGAAMRCGGCGASDPLLPRLPPGDGCPAACSSAGLAAAIRREQPLGTAAAPRRQDWPDTCVPLSFWRTVAGTVIVVSVILLCMRVTLKGPQLETCPDDWLYYQKKCYYHSEAVASWNSSQESCSRYGAFLAVIDSHQELNFIMYRLRITDFWIGLRRKGGKFFWENGESFDTKLFHVNTTNDGNCVCIDSPFISTRRCSSLRDSLCTIDLFNA
ncbi:C-type lectin domain family 2 member L-like isoform X1 [Falco rusticolus]|uniref:C-type lectin domain family 2 member L-like isoform X1 n=1 Tax=Falco rusticolus TaxID=120794 RepID=UPI0018868CA7|nr:C-type lectin domain family 2 member L-like isoform X1 [Falco rusticolus]